MLFNENNIKSIAEGNNTLVSVAREYFNDNMESILVDYDYSRGYLAVREELYKQVMEYVFFERAKAECLNDLEVIKESIKLSEDFKDLNSLYNSTKRFKGKEVYISLLNTLNDELISFSEKVIPLYGSILESCIKYRDSFNSYYYTFFIEGIEIDDEDILCYTIDLVRALLDD